MRSDKKPRIPRKVKKEAKKRVLSLRVEKINTKKLRVYISFHGKHTFSLYEAWVENYSYLSR